MMKKEELIAVVIIVLVVLGVSSCSYFTMLKPDIDKAAFCHEKFNQTYDFWNENMSISYNIPVQGYINCCIEEAHLVNDVYESQICKGYRLS